MEVGNVTLLQKYLREQKFDPDTFVIGAGPVTGYWGYALEPVEHGWQIVFYEKGVASRLETVRDEAEACRRFLERMRKDFPPPGRDKDQERYEDLMRRKKKPSGV